MHNIADSKRRSVLKMMAGAPLLPIAGFGGSMLLAGCGGSSAAIAASAATIAAVSFMSMDAPSAAADQATTSVQSKMLLTMSDGSKQEVALSYQPFFITGENVPDGKGGIVVAGGYFDINNQPIRDVSNASKPQFYSDCPDGYTLLKLDNPTVSGVVGNAVFAVVQFEYTSTDAVGASMYGKLPSPIAILTLDQDKKSGQLKLVKYEAVDTSPAHGLWITCGASISPWNTHLSSEEYEPDATIAATDAGFMAFSQNLFGDTTKANPYHYGHTPEITVKPDGTGSVKKHYCMGRISHELVQVMPDQRTVLMGDDFSNSGLFMFIADRAADLSAGTLYVAKWTQKTADNGGSADLGWIRLGHATSAEIEALANSLKAVDIVEVKTADPADASYTKIGFGGKPNWVKFVPGKEQAGIFLETHRYAAYKGGSLGFTKMEGVTVNAKDKKAYLAMSYIQGTMINGSTDINVKGPKAGAVYQLDLADKQKDAAGTAIDSAWVPVFMATVPSLVGVDLATPDAIGNLADANHIANPDNIKFSERLRTLFIGEDSAMHVNNFLWAYNVDSKLLSRVLSCPAGAEATGLQAVDNLNGFAYIMSNFQHPGDWNVTGLHAKVYQTLDPLINQNYRNKRSGGVGYIQGVQVGAI
ncbi:MAG: alkaline phosphatase PhoX [Oxalobacteraceae bacterium]